MFEFLIDFAATFLGGYYTQKATKDEISLKRYFFIICSILGISFGSYILIDYLAMGGHEISLVNAFKWLVIIFLIAGFLSWGLVQYKKFKRRF